MHRRRFVSLALAVAISLAAAGPAGADWALYAISDCSGVDTGCSAGAMPNPSLCNGGTLGTIAVCWDGLMYANGIGCGSSAWCTYKSVTALACVGGVSPGRVYDCQGPATATPTETLTATPTATPTPTATGTATATATQTGTATVTRTATATATSAVAVCAMVPRGDCTSAPKGALKLTSHSDDPTKYRLSWKWLAGTADLADLGDPTFGSTNYILCIYDDGSLAMSSSVAAGGTCGDTLCWAAKSTGHKYKNKVGNAAGLTQIKLKAGAGKASIQVKGSGANLALPPSIADTSAMTVQFVRNPSAAIECWESVLPAPAKVNDGTRFNDKIP